MNWHDIERSKEPLNWRRMLDELTFTPQELTTALSEGKVVETIVNRTTEVMDKYMNNENKNEEVTDMDELVKQEDATPALIGESEPEASTDTAESEDIVEEDDDDDDDDVDSDDDDDDEEVTDTDPLGESEV